MSVKIFILDDEPLARQRMRILLSDIAAECPTDVVGESEYPQEALDAIALCQPDIVLLDVQMPGISGIEFARHLLQNSQNSANVLTTASRPPSVIFVSAHETYALQAFEVQALDYLLKPVRAQRLQEAVLRAIGLRQARAHETAPAATHINLSVRRQYFSVMVRNRILLVAVDDVLYVKAEQKYLTLHTRDQSYLLEESLQAIEQEMPDVFVRIHRNTLIARTALTGVEKGVDLDEQTDKVSEVWQVILRDCPHRLTISRRMWPTIKTLVKF